MTVIHTLTGLLIKNPTFLYLLAFTGLFTFIVPLLEFSRLFVGFKNTKPLMKAGEHFIILKSTLLHGLLTVTMDDNFDGTRR